MLSRRHFLVSSLFASALISSSVSMAGERIDYSPAAFDAAQKAGRSILVEIHAPWCPTCRAQAPILSELEGQAKFEHLLVVHVDFDSQKDAVQRFGARMQSTLIIFKGQSETARSVGDTNAASIAALLDKAV